jgi:PAS domain-containing protein
LQALADLAGVLAYGDLLGEALVAIDAEWRIAFVNETALRFAGRPRHELVGQSYWDVVPLARGSMVESALREAMTSGMPVELEGESRMHSGRFNRGIAIPLSDGLAISFREVTVQRSVDSERERRHLESEERARLAIEAAAIGTWDVDDRHAALVLPVPGDPRRRRGRDAGPEAVPLAHRSARPGAGRRPLP